MKRILFFYLTGHKFIGSRVSGFPGIFVLIAGLLLYSGSCLGQLVPFAENFAYPTGNLLGNGAWVQQGTDITNPIQVTAPGLYYQNYQSSGIGNASSVGANATGQDLFANFTGANTINTGSVYIAALVKVVSASRAGDYFLSFKETSNASLTVFKGRLYAKDSLAAGNLVFGCTKSASSSSAPVSWTPQYYAFGTTYLVVLKYTFVAGTANDPVDIYVFDPANPFPVAEPATPNATATDAGSDGTGQRCVQLRQGGLNSAIAVVDGIRVGQAWADAVTYDNNPPVAAFNPANGATNVIVSVVPTITFNEPVRKTDGTPITDADLQTLVIFKKTDASGPAVPFTATIDATKTIITITPGSNLLNSQLYYLAVGPVQDGAGNTSTLQSATFTTVGGGLSSDATLSDLKTNGVTVAGFAPSAYTYTVSVPYGVSAVPVVTATPNYALATVNITQAPALPGTATVLVTAEDGITQLTYTINFTVAPPSSDATLKWIKWGPATDNNNKVLVTGFLGSTLTYTVTVPSDMTAAGMAASVNFTPPSGSPGATLVVNQPSTLTGTVAQRTGSVVVTAQDGVTTLTYTVIFQVPQAATYNFKEGFVICPPAGWNATTNVGSTTASNNVGIYPGTTSPKFKWVAPTDGGTLTTGPNNTGGVLEFYVKVLDNNVANNLHLYIEKSYNNTDWILVAQDPMPLTGATSNWYQVSLTLNDNNPTLYLRFRASATYGTNATGLFYLDDISLSALSLADATLSDLKVNGTTIAGFSPATINYNYLVPAGSVTVPTVTATPAQSAATVQVLPTASIPGITSVVVTAPDGITNRTYTVNFTHALIAPANLTATQSTHTLVTLSWSDQNYNETGVIIERKPDNGLFAKVGMVGANITNYTDTIYPSLNPDNFVAANRFSTVTVTTAIKFADVINYKGVPTPLYLDLYQAAGDQTLGRPVIIWIHGGGFRTDSYRTQGYIVDYCNRFAKRGYVCMSIDYRLREGVDMPDQASEYPALQDAARDANAAIDWVRSHAAAYNVDPNLIFVAGGSAGGRTAQTVCQFPGPDPTALYPPENQYLTTPWNKTGMVANATLWGGLEPEMRGWVYPFLQPGGSPTILVHGSADVTILPQNSIDLYDTLISTGIAAELHIIPGATHSCLGYETQISEWVATWFAQEWKKVNCKINGYSYRVQAFNPYGSSPFSNTVTLTTAYQASVSITASQSSVCSGTAVTFTANPVNGGTPVYQWYVNNAAAGANSPTLTIIPANGDQVRVKMTSEITCNITGSPANSNTITVTVFPQFLAGSIAGNQAICTGAQPSLITGTAPSGGSAPYSYQWQFSTDNITFVNISGATNLNYQPGILTVNTWYKLLQTSSGGCGSGLTNVILKSVNPLPVPVITGLQAVCAQTSGVVYATEAGMTGYNWVISPGGTITAGANTNQVAVTWNIAGSQTLSVNYSIPATGCSAATPTVKSITVNPLITPTITGQAAACVNSTGNVYTTQPGMTNYTWSISAGGTITGGSSGNSISVTWLTAGNKTVTCNYTNPSGCNTASAANFPVTVSTLPAPSITGTNNVCAGMTGVVYSTQTGMTGYIWTISPGGTITSGQGTANVNVTWNTIGVQAVTVNYTTPAGCMSSAPGSYSVNVNPAPTPTIGSNNVPCVNSTGNMYYTESGMSGYNWSVSPGGTIVSGAGTNAINVTWNSAGSQWVSVNYTGISGCQAAVPTIYNLFINPLPGAAGSVTGSGAVCAGSPAIAYSTVPITNSTTYLWTLPAGAVISSGAGTPNITVNFAAGAVSGNIVVTGTNNCGNGTPSVPFAVTVNPLPAAAGNITGTSQVCQGATGIVYQTPAIANATGYTWTVPLGCTITSGGNTHQITVSFGTSAVSGNITVQGVNSCGSGTVSQPFAVSVHPVPPAPVVSVNGNILTSSATAGNQWYYEGTGPISGATGQSYEVTNHTGYYWCTVTADGCMSPPSERVWVVVTDISENNREESFSVFPVPNNGIFSISITCPTDETFAVEVSNSLGSLIHRIPKVSLNGGRAVRQIDLTNQPAGIYTVKFKGSRSEAVRKIIIQ